MPSHHPKAQRTQGERRRRAKATPESNKSLQERGGDLHRLQLNRKRRLPQDGPTAAQLRWTTYSGGVFYIFTSKGPRHQGAVWRFNVIYKEQGTISIIELLAHKTKPASVQTGLRTSCGFLRVPQLVLSSPSFSRTHHHPLTTDHGLRGPQTHGLRLLVRLINRVSAHRKRAPEIVDERRALLGMNCAMLRNLAGPRLARRAQRTHW